MCNSAFLHGDVAEISDRAAVDQDLPDQIPAAVDESRIADIAANPVDDPVEALRDGKRNDRLIDSRRRGSAERNRACLVKRDGSRRLIYPGAMGRDNRIRRRAHGLGARALRVRRQNSGLGDAVVMPRREIGERLSLRVERRIARGDRNEIGKLSHRVNRPVAATTVNRIDRSKSALSDFAV